MVSKARGTHLPFNFQLVLLPWNAREIEAAIDRYEGILPEHGWPNWVLGNHDNSRVASRVGREQARIAAMLLLTLRGTPTLYYGDEIGMENVEIPPEKVQDPQEKNIPGKNLNRDPERTPMQWDDSENAGFSEVEPWLPLMDNYQELNVKKQEKDDNSMLNFQKRLISLRNNEPVINIGDYLPVPGSGNILSYIRKHSGKEFLIVLNLGSSEEHFTADIPDLKGVVKLATNPEIEGQQIGREISIAGNSGFIAEINAEK